MRLINAAVDVMKKSSASESLAFKVRGCRGAVGGRAAGRRRESEQR